ncbi:MAG: D-alanine--D-alanine ligase family protein [Steroidobacteraceae bacterium]
MSASSKIRVGVLFGGQSAEHEISILSARNIVAALDRTRFEPVLVGIDKAGRWLAQDEQRLIASARDPRAVSIEKGAASSVEQTAARVDVVFPVLHGTLGEDGAMQGLLEVAGIPYVGAGVLGSAVGMDKDVMKRLLRDAGIPITPFETIRSDRFEADPVTVCREVAKLGFPLFTKPANAGSSVGIRKVKSAGELEDAIRFAFRYDVKVVVEAGVTAREIEFAVLGGNPATVSVAGEIVVEHKDGFYSYDAKYLDEKGARLELPAKLSADELKQAQAMALQTFEVLECDGLARVDLFLTGDGELLVNEINTLPGFTAISMYPKLWALSGLTQTELITRLIDLAIRRADRRKAIWKNFGA